MKIAPLARAGATLVASGHPRSQPHRHSGRSMKRFFLQPRLHLVGSIHYQ